MAATRQDIERWLQEGLEKGATHVIVVCDSYDYCDYPKFVMPGQDPRKMAKNLGNMQRLMEVYSLKKDLKKQLNEFRAFHYD